MIKCLLQYLNDEQWYRAVPYMNVSMRVIPSSLETRKVFILILDEKNQIIGEKVLPTFWFNKLCKMNKLIPV